MRFLVSFIIYPMHYNRQMCYVLSILMATDSILTVLMATDSMAQWRVFWCMAVFTILKLVIRTTLSLVLVCTYIYYNNIFLLDSHHSKVHHFFQSVYRSGKQGIEVKCHSGKFAVSLCAAGRDGDCKGRTWTRLKCCSPQPSTYAAGYCTGPSCNAKDDKRHSKCHNKSMSNAVEDHFIFRNTWVKNCFSIVVIFSFCKGTLINGWCIDFFKDIQLGLCCYIDSVRCIMYDKPWWQKFT